MYNQQLNELLEYPTVENTQTLIFNKITGAFIASMVGSHLDKVNTTYCKGKTATFNPETHVWVGDYDTGSVKAKTDTIQNLLEILPPGTPDPSSQVYNKTMVVMACLLGIALVANFLVKPVDPKHHMSD